MCIRDRLKEVIGEPAGRLHTGRSRNDQVATDFRLWVRDQCDAAIDALRALIRAALSQAERGADWVMPGFTHLQTAQPVTWGHHMMAYVEMFGRDLSRFQDARKRMNESPLGAAALAGTEVYVDHLLGALDAAAELGRAVAEHGLNTRAVRGDLAALVTGRSPAPTGQRPVFFRSVGLGLEDAAIAHAVLAAVTKESS